MITLKPANAQRAYATLLVWPPRRLSRRGLWVLMAGLAAAALAVAWLSARQGNVFAPVFALLEAVAVGGALTWAWRKGNHGERITVGADALEVMAWPERRCRARYQSYWVRVRLRQDAGRQRLLLQSHGRETEVGAFLADEERLELARDLRAALAGITGQHRA